MTEPQQQEDSIDAEGSAATASADAPQYGVGPFSIREVVIGGIWLIAFIVSFFSLSTVRFDSVWTSGLLWVLTIGVPTVAVFLIGLRRLSPEGIRRVGSLGIDQFASVAFSVSTVVWVQLIWETVAVVAQGGPWLRSWVMWVEFVLMLAGVIVTVFAPFIPPFDEDFRGRREVPAHRNARPLRAVTARPAPVRAAVEPSTADTDDATAVFDSEPLAAAAGAGAAGAAGADADAWTPSHRRGTYESGAAADDASPVRHQAFWALVPEERDVVDEHGVPVFRIGPTAWALVIEDRGDSFVVRHEDGRIGRLDNVEGVTRG